jgi:hypothetical protein
MNGHTGKGKARSGAGANSALSLPRPPRLAGPRSSCVVLRLTPWYTICSLTHVRVILMNGVETEALRFSHACARMNRDLQQALAHVRRVEQHQQTLQPGR